MDGGRAIRQRWRHWHFWGVGGGVDWVEVIAFFGCGRWCHLGRGRWYSLGVGDGIDSVEVMAFKKQTMWHHCNAIVRG